MISGRHVGPPQAVLLHAATGAGLRGCSPVGLPPHVGNGDCRFTVELTRGSERKVVDTISYFDVPLGPVIAAAHS